MIDLNKTITSNNTKLLKHLDKLKDIQDGRPVSPVMVHLALTDKCNLNCDYCCYGGRDKSLELSVDKAINAIDAFYKLGTRGLEITGGGDPLLHPMINPITEYGFNRGMTVGLITNGLAYDKFSEWDKLSWVRLSSHALNKGNERFVKNFTNAIIAARKGKKQLNVGSVHIYTGDNDNLSNVVRFMDEYNIPTRITPDLTKSPEWIKENMEYAKNFVKNSRMCFISDFNVKFDRITNNCYMRLIKPYIHPDGNVYECPGASFSPENFCNVDSKYKICSIDDIFKTYTSKDILNVKDYDCRFCKYQSQNELINDILTETRDNDFA